MQFIRYADPGHSWIKTTHKKLRELGIHLKISSYSYQRGEAVYLEEDADYGHLIDAVGSCTTKTFHTNQQSRIRNYEPYRPRITLEEANRLLGVKPRMAEGSTE